MRFTLIASGLLALFPAALLAKTCPMAPEPVVMLEYDSRYQADSTTRSELDSAADAEVNSFCQQAGYGVAPAAGL